MNAEWSSELRERARVHAALGEPARLAIVDRLVLGDASPTELAQDLGLPSNLLAHHLKLLEQAGILERSRSEGDRRRTYLRLRANALAGLKPAGARSAPRVVFVCTHNSARSQLAAALWAGQSPVPATSAGTHPVARIHPRAAAPEVTVWSADFARDEIQVHIEGARPAGDNNMAACEIGHLDHSLIFTIVKLAVGSIRCECPLPLRPVAIAGFPVVFKSVAFPSVTTV